jgi:hypothetical protein
MHANDLTTVLCLATIALAVFIVWRDLKGAK